VLNIKKQVCVEHKDKLGHNYDVYFLPSFSELRDRKKKRSLALEIQAEEDQDREIAQEDILNELKVNYINQIASRVHNQWRYQGAKDSWGCDVHILQDVDGNAQSVNVQTCNIDNNAKAKSFKNAIERAVYKASPLPPAPDTSVFDREILFHFRVN
jgi:colicin import membrane protein